MTDEYPATPRGDGTSAMRTEDYERLRRDAAAGAGLSPFDEALPRSMRSDEHAEWLGGVRAGPAFEVMLPRKAARSGRATGAETVRRPRWLVYEPSQR